MTLYAVDSVRFAGPPSDDEKNIYLAGGQGRTFVWLQMASFLAASVSLVGFATTSYWTLIFFFPFGLLFVQQVVATFSSSRPRRITLESHQEVVTNWRPTTHPSVDIFLATAGETLALLENTMHHLARVRWRGNFRISILDDSGRRSVGDMAARYGFTYFARSTHEYKKAGNLRYAAERTDYDIISILDADFVPRPDYLYDLVPYFDDPALGIVQSPQFFDTSREMNWIQRTAGATQELFYRFIQPSRDHSDGAICVGTSALYRRKALDSIGGFVVRSDSEDVWTGYMESKVGYATRYVPIVVTKGLCPDDLDSFISQQYRWCSGSMDLLADSEFHTDEDMTLVARLGFWSGFLYYIGTALTSLTIPLPVIIMSAFYAEYVRWWNTIWLIGLPVLWLMAYPMYMRGRWRMEVLRLQTVYGFAHLFQIVHWAQGRVSSEWHSTGSVTKTSLGPSVRRFYARYLGVLICVMVPVLIWRTFEYGLVRFAGMLIFAGFNLYVVGPLVWCEARDRFYGVARQKSSLAPVLEDVA